MKDGYYVAYDKISNERMIVEVVGREVMLTGTDESLNVEDFDFGPNPSPLDLTRCAFIGRENSSILEDD